MKATTRKEYEERVQRVQEYIRMRLDEPHSLEALARIAHFSPYHFHRVFRAIVGLPLGAWIRHERIQAAGQALMDTDRSVLEIALDAGYESHEAFTRAFSKHMGCSPRLWRRGVRATRSVWVEEGLFHCNEKGSVMDIETKHMDAFSVFAVERQGDYAGFSSALHHLVGSVSQAGGLQQGARIVGLFYDDPESTPVANARYDACLEILEGASKIQPRGVVRKEVEGGLYASLMHVGAYSRLGESYDRLFRSWLPESGYEPRNAPCVEIYISDPQTTPESDLKTEILIPITGGSV